MAYMRTVLKRKKIVPFSPLLQIETTRFKTVFFVKLPTYAISVSLAIEIHENNIETSRVTKKQYYKIILFQKLLLNETDIFRELLLNTTDFPKGNCTRQYFFLSQMLTYSESLLVSNQCKQYLQNSVDVKKLKTIPRTNTRPFNIISRIVACNSIT